MEKVLVDQNSHWKGEAYDIQLSRVILPELLKLLNIEEILVLLGVRRSGKTTLFRALINHLMEGVDSRSILYINVDDPVFDAMTKDASKLYEVVETAEKHVGVKIQFLFLDEIQNIIKWEKFVKSIYDSRLFKQIFITGSNSSLLHTDYTTLLSGRYLEEFITPLSFKEILMHHNITDQTMLISQKAHVLSLVDTMIHFGSFPRVFLEKDDHVRRKVLAKYYQTILLKDCARSGNIRDVRLLKELSHYLLSNISTRYSYNNLTEYVDSSEHTIKDYIAVLSSGFLINEVPNFSFSIKKQARGKKKVYCIDNGFITAVGFNFMKIEGPLFENLVYTELLKNGADEIFVYHEVKECDFILKVENEFVAIQVCYALNMDNRPREIEGLKLGMAKSKASRGYIITYDQEESIDENMQVIPFWKLFAKISDIGEL